MYTARKCKDNRLSENAKDLKNEMRRRKSGPFEFDKNNPNPADRTPEVSLSLIAAMRPRLTADIEILGRRDVNDDIRFNIPSFCRRARCTIAIQDDTGRTMAGMLRSHPRTPAFPQPLLTSSIRSRSAHPCALSVFTGPVSEPPPGAPTRARRKP